MLYSNIGWLAGFGFGCCYYYYYNPNRFIEILMSPERKKKDPEDRIGIFPPCFLESVKDRY